MAAYSTNFVSGAYSVTYDSVLMGYTEMGFEKVVRPSANVIRLDPTGRTPIDAILTGVEDIIVRVESMEWSSTIWAKAINFLFAGATEGAAEKAGQLLVAGSLAKTLLLSPVTKTGPSYTFTKAYPMEPVRSIFSAQRLRTTTMGFFVFAQAFDATTLIPTLYTTASVTI